MFQTAADLSITKISWHFIAHHLAVHDGMQMLVMQMSDIFGYQYSTKEIFL